MGQRIVNNHKYYYFYKITNLINNKFYFGIHCTDNLEDNYMGSGQLLHKAYEKYGIENFKKEILIYFDTWTDALEYEKQMVNEELIKDPNCYNISTGGIAFAANTVIVYDPSQNKNIMIPNNDERFLSGQLKTPDKGMVVVRDKNGKCFKIQKNDERYISGELKHITKDIHKTKYHKDHLSTAANKNVQNGTHNLVNTCFVYKFDDGNNKIRKRIKIDNLEEYLNSGWLKSNLNQSSYNGPEKRWIHKGNEELLVERNKIRNYIEDGWKTGHSDINKSKNIGKYNSQYGKHQKQIYFINDDGIIINKQIDVSLVDEYISNGWILGRKRIKK